MDYLTFTLIHSLVICSLCGITYLTKQCVAFIRWLVKIALKDLDENED